MAYQSAHTGREIDSAVSGVMTAMGEDFSDPLVAQADLQKARPIAKTLSWSGSTGNYTATIEIENAIESTSVDPMVWIMGTDHNRYYCDYSVTKSGTTYTITIHSNHNLSGTAYIYGIVAPR